MHTVLRGFPLCFAGLLLAALLAPSTATAQVPDVYFNLVTSHSGRCLDVPGEAVGNEIGLIQFDCRDQANQQFRLQPIGDAYQVIARHSGQCLDVSRVSTDDGAIIWQFDCIGAQQTNQLFFVDEIRPGLVNLRAAHSNKCVTVRDNEDGNGTPIEQQSCGGAEQFNQLFRLRPSGGPFQIVSKFSNKCADVAGVSSERGADVYQVECIGPQQQNQLWSMEEFAFQGYYRVRPQHSGGCLDVAATSTADGANVYQWDCVDSNEQRNQLWRIRPVGDAFQLLATHSGKCLDLRGPSLDTGTTLQQFECSGAQQTNQLWYLYPSDNLTATDTEEATEVPATYALGQNYPNPFAERTTLPFTLREADQVRIVAYNVLGREVAVLADRFFTAGTHEAVFEAETLPSGIYTVRLTIGATTLARRVAIVR